MKKAVASATSTPVIIVAVVSIFAPAHFPTAPRASCPPTDHKHLRHGDSTAPGPLRPAEASAANASASPHLSFHPWCCSHTRRLLICADGPIFSRLTTFAEEFVALAMSAPAAQLCSRKIVMAAAAASNTKAADVGSGWK